MVVPNQHYDKFMAFQEIRAPFVMSLESIIDLSEDVAEHAREVFLLAEPYPLHLTCRRVRLTKLNIHLRTKPRID